MNDKNYLILISLTAILLTVSVIYLAGTTDVFVHRSNMDSEEIHIPTFETIPEQTVDCELCHIQPEELTKHINGGNYCAACHETETSHAPPVMAILIIRQFQKSYQSSLRYAIHVMLTLMGRSQATEIL
jgi:hypothetical protein